MQAEELPEQAHLARLETEDAQAIDLGEALLRRVLALRPRDVAHDVGEERVRVILLGLVGLAVDEREVAGRRDRAELADEPRLADARFADEANHVAFAWLFGLERQHQELGELAQLFSPPDEGQALDLAGGPLVSPSERLDLGDPALDAHPERALDLGHQIRADAGLARGAAHEQRLGRREHLVLRLEDHAVGDPPFTIHHHHAGRRLPHGLEARVLLELHRGAHRQERRALHSGGLSERGHPEIPEDAEHLAVHPIHGLHEAPLVCVARVGEQVRHAPPIDAGAARHGEGCGAVGAFLPLLRERSAAHRRGVLVGPQHQIDAQLVRCDRLFGREHPRHRLGEVGLTHELAAPEEPARQISVELARRRVPLVTVQREALEHDGLELLVDARGAEGRDVRLPHEREGLLRGLAPKEARAREHLEEHHAEGEEIAPSIEGLAAGLLGRHVRVLAAEDLGIFAPPQARLVGARDPEVGDLHLAFVAKEHVLRRDVPVDDLHGPTVVTAPAVGVLERLGDLTHDPDAEGQRETIPRPSERHGLAEILAVDVLHRDVVRAALLAQLEDLGDVGVGEARRDLRFAHQQIREARLAHQGGEHPLDDHGLLEARGALGPRFPDLGHAALGDALEELVRSEDQGNTRHERGRYQIGRVSRPWDRLGPLGPKEAARNLPC